MKLYCYALRPALALEWIRQFQKTPVMDIYSMCNRLQLSQDLIAEIGKLVVLKAEADEGDVISRIGAIDDFIISVLKEKAKKHEKNEVNNQLIVKADQLFRQLIGS